MSASFVIYQILFLGVDNERFQGKKVTEKVISEICKTNEMEDAIEREAIYEGRRPEIQYKFRYTLKSFQ